MAIYTNTYVVTIKSDRRLHNQNVHSSFLHQQTELTMNKQTQSLSYSSELRTHLNDSQEEAEQDAYYELNQKLEQKIAIDTAELVQFANKLARKNSQLEKANKELENFARTVSHDLQEPLRSIGMFSELLQAEYKESLDSQAQEYLGYVVSSVQRMDTLIKDLLSYSRAGKNEQTWVETDLSELAKIAVEDLQASITEAEAEVSIGNLPTLIVNPTEIIQLLRNLISNSLKFRGNRKPSIEIYSHRYSDRWMIAVEDNGIGIEPEYQEHIFEIFKRLHPQSDYPGSGIGLSICQKIVERHQGQIGVKSQLGNGSTFYFTLPSQLRHR